MRYHSGMHTSKSYAIGAADGLRFRGRLVAPSATQTAPQYQLPSKAPRPSLTALAFIYSRTPPLGPTTMENSAQCGSYYRDLRLAAKSSCFDFVSSARFAASLRTPAATPFAFASITTPRRPKTKAQQPTGGTQTVTRVLRTRQIQNSMIQLYYRNEKRSYNNTCKKGATVAGQKASKIFTQTPLDNYNSYPTAHQSRTCIIESFDFPLTFYVPSI